MLPFMANKERRAFVSISLIYAAGHLYHVYTMMFKDYGTKLSVEFTVGGV